MTMRLGKFPTRLKCAFLLCMFLLPALTMTTFSQQATQPAVYQMPTPFQFSDPMSPLATLDASSQSLLATLDARNLSFQETAQAFQDRLKQPVAPFSLPTTNPYNNAEPRITVTGIAGLIAQGMLFGVLVFLIFTVAIFSVGYDSMLKFIVRVAAFFLLTGGFIALGVASLAVISGVSAFMQYSSRDEMVRAAALLGATTALGITVSSFVAAMMMLLLGAIGLLFLSTHNRIQDMSEDVGRLSLAVRQRAAQSRSAPPPQPPLPMP